jgi:hypothetical protein
MQNKMRTLTGWLGSGWFFAATTALFSLEAGWLALTSRFPGAFDEAYHFSLIRFYADHLNPIITSQTPDTYRFGPLVQNTSFLYHYLMSFPYRLMELFTSSLEVQAAGLRLVNVALMVAGLLLMRKFLHLLGLSRALTNVLVLAFALTPIVAVLAAQINYDNLLVPAVLLCMYLAVSFLQALEKRRFDTVRLLALVCLCLFAGLIKYAFLPVLAGIAVTVAWRIAGYRRHNPGKLMAQAEKSWRRSARYVRILLTIGLLAGGFLFLRVYGVNLVRYHNPVPPCEQVLSVAACKHYYAWHNVYGIQNYVQTHHAAATADAFQYGSYWFLANIFMLFGAQVPLQGHLFAPPPYLFLVGVLGAGMFICTVVNFPRLLRRNRALLLLAAVCLTYLVCLWAKNYYDFGRVGQVVAIHGRYFVPILIYLYVLLALGLRAALEALPARRTRGGVKAALALVIIVSFVYYGGFRQYVAHVTPVYGHLSPSDNFILSDASPDGR